MTIVVAVLAVVVVLLSVLVAGLLRSHATILRRLHELGAGTAGGAGARSTLDPGAPTTSRVVPRTDGSVPSPRPDVPDGRLAADISGVGPRGEAIAARVLEVPHDTVLVFLSSGCTTCLGFWADLATPRLPAGTRLLVVTRGPEEESPSAVLELAPADATVVMSTRAWDELQVPGSPFVVLVDGPSGRVVGEGTAASWDQVLALFLRADGDDRLGASPVGDAGGAGDRSGGKAAADRRRERELDQLLLDAGIAPGDPSLYTPPSHPAPSHQGPDEHDHEHGHAGPRP